MAGQVASILDGHVTAAELLGMHKLRHAELQEQIATDAARLAQVTPVIQPLYHELPPRLSRAGIAITCPGVAYYEDAGEAGAVKVHAALPRYAQVRRRPG